MIFQHIYEKGLAQASYLIGCQATRTAMVIDPRRDIDVYLEVAAKEKLQITHVVETHIHADFLSGTGELAARTKAGVWLSAEGGPDWSYAFEHRPLKQGTALKVGNLKIEVIHTPGHTPEHLSFLLTDLPAGDVPVMLFSGDFVFVGDVGRPDLLEKAAGIEGTQQEGAKGLFDSLQWFKSLPDFVQMWPGHGAGSACGKALGAVPSSTVGYEKMVNWALRTTDRDAFVSALLEGQPEPPLYFAKMKQMNKVGPKILGDYTAPPRLDLRTFSQLMHQGAMIVDARSRSVFAARHIKGSINVQDNNSFTTWAGWVIRYDRPFVLITTPDRMAELTRRLIRIGLDHCRGYAVFDDLDGLETDTLRVIDPATAGAWLKNGTAVPLDVRSAGEYKEGTIEGAMHIHAGHVSGRYQEIPGDRKVIVFCEGGDRSSTAASLLKKAGLTNVYNLEGGMSAWRSRF